MKEFELEPDEHVVIEARKHWLLFLSELLPFAILAVLPFALPKLLVLVPFFIPYASYFEYQSIVMRAVLGVWLLIVWTLAWVAFTRYFLNAWILTNHRIVTIKQRRFFSREVSSLFLNRVQDVTTNVVGILSSLLNIGDIQVQTAGEDVVFVMRDIPHPERLCDVILRYVSTKPENTGV